MAYIVNNSENVVLTHIIKCHLEADEIEFQGDETKCSFGHDEKAVIYCDLCQAFYCKFHDEDIHGKDDVPDKGGKGDINDDFKKKLKSKHVKVPVDKAKPKKFGMCSVHPNKPNEYYDKRTNLAKCSTCAMILVQASKENE